MGRLTNFFGFILVLGLIVSALILQYWHHLNPCPLCIMQRIAFITIAALFFIFTFLPSSVYWTRAHGLLLILTAGSGLGVALRQLYLQHLPVGQAPSCGPGLNYLFQSLPWNEAFMKVLQGSGECAVVDWRFLGLSMAGWSALWLAFCCCWGLKKLFHRS